MTWYASYALHNYHIRPKEFAEMTREERAMIIATIDTALEECKRE